MIVKTYEEMFGQKLTIKDLVNGFTEDTKTGKVTGFGGKLDIRPPYQRQFVYEMDKQRAVIKTVLAGYPLNVMYWAKKDDGTFELILMKKKCMETILDLGVKVVRPNTEIFKCFVLPITLRNRLTM